MPGSRTGKEDASSGSSTPCYPRPVEHNSPIDGGKQQAFPSNGAVTPVVARRGKTPGCYGRESSNRCQTLLPWWIASSGQIVGDEMSPACSPSWGVKVSPGAILAALVDLEEDLDEGERSIVI